MKVLTLKPLECQNHHFHDRNAYGLDLLLLNFLMDSKQKCKKKVRSKRGANHIGSIDVCPTRH